MQLLRQHHDAEWELLSVYELWEYQRVFVANIVVGPHERKLAAEAKSDGRPGPPLIHFRYRDS